MPARRPQPLIQRYTPEQANALGLKIGRRIARLVVAKRSPGMPGASGLPSMIQAAPITTHALMRLDQAFGNN